MYTRFTRAGRMLFLAHEWLMFFRHPTELQQGETYKEVIAGHDFEKICKDMQDNLGWLSICLSVFAIPEKVGQHDTG